MTTARAAAAVRRAARGARAAGRRAPPTTRPAPRGRRVRRPARGRAPAPGADGHPRGRRLRSRRLAARRRAAPVRAGDRAAATSASPRATTCTTSPAPSSAALHEFGHGLYEAGIPAAARAQPARHRRSRSACTSRRAGCGRTWSAAAARSAPGRSPLLRREPARASAGRRRWTTLYRGVNAVHPSLIRVESDETTYNLHIVLRFELELALIEGTLAVDDAAGARGTRACTGCSGSTCPTTRQGVLQDVHWGAGLIGYFPTYTLGNLMAAQLWETLRADLPDDRRAARARRLRARCATGSREQVHVHGRKLPAARAAAARDGPGARRRALPALPAGEAR